MCSYIIDKRKQKNMENLDKIYKLVRQSSPTGINAAKIARELGRRDNYRTTVQRYLNTLEVMGKVKSLGHGLWITAGETGEREPYGNFILKRFFMQVDDIKKILFGNPEKLTNGDSINAFGRMRFLIAQLPSPIYDKAKTEEKKLLKLLPDYNSEDYDAACYHFTRILLDRVCRLLYQEYGEFPKNE